MNVDLRDVQRGVIYIRAVQKYDGNSNDDNGDQMPKKTHCMQSNLRNTRVASIWTRQEFHFRRYIGSPGQDKEPILGSPCNPKTTIYRVI